MRHGDQEHGRWVLAAGALALFGSLLMGSDDAMAAKGDCAQPTSTGASPKTSDALTILKESVGIATDCRTLSCACDVNGSGTITTSDALVTLKKAVGQAVTLGCKCAVYVSDDFNDDTRDPARWGDDFVSGNGALAETSHVLQYTCATGTTDDESLRPWEGGVFPYAANWEVQLDVTDLAIPTKNTQFHSVGIDVIDAKDGNNEFYAELYLSRVGGPPYRSGFYGELYKGGTYLAYADTFGIGVTAGAVRLKFDATTKVVTLSYDTDPTNGYTWVDFGSFGLAGSGGADGNTNWGLTSADRFSAAIYGYSASSVIPAGQIFGDNFVATGGLVP